MKIHRFLVPKEKFLKLPVSERLFLVFAGHITNELTVLNRLVLFANQTKAKTKLEQEARVTQILVIQRLLTGKLFEAWECLRKIYFATVLPKVYEKRIDPRGIESLEILKKHFGKKSTLFLIRNKFSFHYSVDEVETWLKKYSRKEPLQFNVGESYGNSVFTFAEEIIMNTALDMINEKSSKKAFGKVLDESLLVNKHFREFLSYAMVPIVTKYFGKNLKALKARKITVKGSPKFENVSIPCFIEIPPRPNKKRHAEF